MLVAAELKGELARIQPARACCRRAELMGLLYASPRDAGVGATRVRTLDHATARVAVHLAGSMGVPALGPMRGPGRHHLEVMMERADPEAWTWQQAKPCDRRAFLRGAVLNASISLGPASTHVEFVFHDRARARELLARLRSVNVRGRLLPRRGRSVVYIKGQEEVATLLRLTGANRALLDFEAGRVARDVRNRLNRLLNAEEANLDRTVRAADRQLHAIAQLRASGELERLSEGLREVAEQRRRHPDADLDTLAGSLGISRSAVNHRLRRLVSLAAESAAEAS
jgi:DNA-binding transcriptional regulator WhiA